MESILVNHTTSEVRLHRILYLVKYLRAMVLNLLLVVVSIGIAVLAGIDNVYFMATGPFNEWRAEVASDPSSILSIFIQAITIIAFLLWMYLSIVNVWRVALKLQAIFLLVGCVGLLVIGFIQVSFSFHNLALLFSVIAVLSYVATYIMGFDAIIAFWLASKSPEKSSFVATLDGRLAPTFWAYINRLLDLPRTPFRNWRAAGAYALSFCGALIQLTSLLYLITFGAIFTKLTELTSSCVPLRMSACFAQSSVWSYEILLWFGISLIGFCVVAPKIQAKARAIGALSVHDILRKGAERFVLYLRPFDTDDVKLPKPRLPALSELFEFRRPLEIPVEQELFDVSDGYLPLIALSNPKSKRLPAGGEAYRAYLDNFAWEEYVGDKIRQAYRIVIILKDSPGVRSELDRLLAEGATARTLFLFPPEAKDPLVWQSIATSMLPSFGISGVLIPGFKFRSHALGFCFRDGKVIEIENSNWSATSYRTAFSCFLADRVNA